MRPGTGFPGQGIIAESPPNRSCAAASRLALATSRIAYEIRMSAAGALLGGGAHGRWERGCVTEDRIWFSWLRSAGRFAGALPILSRWHCVRRQSSARSPRLQQGLTTAHRGTPMHIMPAITSGGTTPIVTTAIIVTSRADRAGTPAWRKCRREAWPIPMPALRRALPASPPRLADSVHRTSSPKRAATSAAIPRAAPACGAPGS